MFKPNDLVRIKKLALNDVFPIYGKPFKLEEGDVCEILIYDKVDEKYPYFLRLGKEEFWLSSNTELIKVEDENENEYLRQEIQNVVSQLNKLLDFLDNE